MVVFAGAFTVATIAISPVVEILREYCIYFFIVSWLVCPSLCVQEVRVVIEGGLILHILIFLESSEGWSELRYKVDN